MSDLRRVIVVEDDDDVATMLKLALELDGRFEVVGIAYDGASGLDLAREVAPDGVILDNLMPGRSGVAILPELRAACPGARIVLLSAYVAAASDALALGADAYIRKSDDIRGVLDVLAD